MSTQIQLERQQYYTVSELSQKGALDITHWLMALRELIGFLKCDRCKIGEHFGESQVLENPYRNTFDRKTEINDQQDF